MHVVKEMEEDCERERGINQRGGQVIISNVKILFQTEKIYITALNRLKVSIL